MICMLFPNGCWCWYLLTLQYASIEERIRPVGTMNVWTTFYGYLSNSWTNKPIDMSLMIQRQKKPFKIFILRNYSVKTTALFRWEVKHLMRTFELSQKLRYQVSISLNTKLSLYLYSCGLHWTIRVGLAWPEETMLKQRFSYEGSRSNVPNLIKKTNWEHSFTYKPPWYLLLVNKISADTVIADHIMAIQHVVHYLPLLTHKRKKMGGEAVEIHNAQSSGWWHHCYCCVESRISNGRSQWRESVLRHWRHTEH